jgi:hypothetical protein
MALKRPKDWVYGWTTPIVLTIAVVSVVIETIGIYLRSKS